MVRKKWFYPIFGARAWQRLEDFFTRELAVIRSGILNKGHEIDLSRKYPLSLALQTGPFWSMISSMVLALQIVEIQRGTRALSQDQSSHLTIGIRVSYFSLIMKICLLGLFQGLEWTLLPRPPCCSFLPMREKDLL